VASAIKHNKKNKESRMKRLQVMHKNYGSPSNAYDRLTALSKLSNLTKLPVKTTEANLFHGATAQTGKP